MNNVLILLDNLDDWKPYYETSSVLTVSGSPDNHWGYA